MSPLTDSDEDYMKRRTKFIKDPKNEKEAKSLQKAILKYEDS
jgi:hypothetical protein